MKLLKKLFILVFTFFIGISPTVAVVEIPDDLADQGIVLESQGGGVYTPKTSPSRGLYDSSTQINGFKLENGKFVPIKVTKPSGFFEDTSTALIEMAIGREEALVKSDGTFVMITRPGAIDQTLATAGRFYEPTVLPASDQVVATFNDITDKVNPIETVNAQQESTVYYPGLGFNILQPIRSFWSMNRNIAYGLEIIVIFVIAIMLLFRGNLSGQGMITLMNALPSIVLSIILITFSYAISGLFIDLITVGANFVQSALVSFPGSPGYSTVWNGGKLYWSEFCDIEDLQTITDSQGNQIKNPEGDSLCYTLRSFQEIGQGQIPVTQDGNYLEPIDARQGIQINDALMSVWLIFGTADLNIDEQELLQLEFFPEGAILNTQSPIGGMINGLKTSLTQIVSQDEVATLSSKLLTLVLVFAAFMASFRIFLELLKSWLTLIVMPVVSPFLALLAAIPTQTSKMIFAFINPMLAASLSFIAVYAIFLFMLVISKEPLIDGLTFTPPLLGYGPTSSVQAGGEVVRVLIGYGLFLATPSVPGVIRAALPAGGPTGAAAGIGKDLVGQIRDSVKSLYGFASGRGAAYQGKRFPGQ